MVMRRYLQSYVFYVIDSSKSGNIIKMLYVLVCSCSANHQADHCVEVDGEFLLGQLCRDGGINVARQDLHQGLAGQLAH